MMSRFSVRLTVSVIFLIGIILSGCGLGGESSEVSTPSGPIAAVAWDPPMVDGDGLPMDPKRDIEYYEFYLRTDQNFTDGDLPVAHVSSFYDVLAPDGKSFTRKLTKEFALDNLLPFTEKGKKYYVSLRVVGVDGLKSGFMVSLAWDLS
jgi:hypothetical protein